MRMLGGLAILAATVTMAACQTTRQPPTEEEKAVVGISQRVDASLRDAALNAEKRGDYQSALLHYRSAYQRDDSHLETVAGLSRALRNVGRPKQAIAISERGLEVHKRHPVLLAELGKGHLADGDAMAAIDSLSRAGALQPDDWRVNSALGIAYDRIGMYDQAARRYKMALENNANNPVILNNMALSKAQMGELDEAVEILEKATAQPDATAHTRQNLALLYAAQGRIDTAERLVRSDLDEKTANENMVYYRWLARNGRGEPVGVPVQSKGPSSSIIVPDGNSPDGTLKVSRDEILASEVPGATAKRDVRVIPMTPDDADPQGPTSDTAGRDGAPTPTGPPATPAAAGEADTAPDADRRPETPAPAAAVPTAGEGIAKPSATVTDAGSAPAEANEAAPTAMAVASTTPASATETTSTGDPPPRSKAGPSATTSRVRIEDQVDGLGAAPRVTPPPAPAARETEPVKTANAPPAMTAGSSVFRVQLGSYRNRDDANNGIQILQTRHGDILEAVELAIMAVTLPDAGDYFQVMTAPFPSRVAAAEMCQKFKSRDVGCLVLRRR